MAMTTKATKLKVDHSIVFKQAHAEAREVVKIVRNYAIAFSFCLRRIYKNLRDGVIKMVKAKKVNKFEFLEAAQNEAIETNRKICFAGDIEDILRRKETKTHLSNFYMIAFEATKTKEEITKNERLSNILNSDSFKKSKALFDGYASELSEISAFILNTYKYIVREVKGSEVRSTEFIIYDYENEKLDYSEEEKEQFELIKKIILNEHFKAKKDKETKLKEKAEFEKIYRTKK